MTLLSLWSLLSVVEVGYLLRLLAAVAWVCELRLLRCWWLVKLLLVLLNVLHLRLRTIWDLLLVLYWTLYGRSMRSIFAFQTSWSPWW